MKSRTLAFYVLLVVGVLWGGRAVAVPMLTVTPETDSVALGAQAVVSVGVSGLTDEFVGAYDIRLQWDSSLLSLASVAFGIFLDGPDGSLTSVVTADGSVNVAEVSLGLLVNQDGFSDFTLFTLTYDTLAIGDSLLQLVAGIDPFFSFLGDGLGFELQAIANDGVLTVVEPVSASEPSVSWLLMLGAGLAYGMRRIAR